MNRFKSKWYDKAAHRRNIIRKRKYRQFTRPSEVVTYNLRDLPPDHELVRKYGKELVDSVC